MIRKPMFKFLMTLALSPRKNPRRKVAFLLRLTVGRNLDISKTRPTKPLYKSMNKKQYLKISLTKQEGFLIF